MFFRSLRNKKKSKRGFTLIELAIVLAVTSLLTVGLWRMMASGNTQLRDQAAADQHKELIAAVKAYLATSEGKALIDAKTPGLSTSAFNLAFNYGQFPNFLPVGFDANTANSYAQTYEIQVRNDSNDSYSFMIKTTGGETIPDSSGGRISSLIGGDGGFVYGADICGNPSNRACGAFGSWNADPAVAAPNGYGFPSVDAGQVASRTFVGGGTADLNQPWLARIEDTFSGLSADVNGIREYNKIQTNISLGDNTIFGATDLDANGLGEIRNIRTLDLKRDSVENSGNPLVSISSDCDLETNTTPAMDAAIAANLSQATLKGLCNDALHVKGDVTFTGRLNAGAIYGARYIYETTSDRRLKKDLKPIDDVLGKFSKINAYSFIRRDTGKKEYGVIAQDVEKVFPALVSPIDNGYKGVDYMGLIGPLVAAVKELNARNNELKAEIESLKQERSIKK